MILDEEPKPVPDDMALIIPARDTPFAQKDKNLPTDEVLGSDKNVLVPAPKSASKSQPLADTLAQSKSDAQAAPKTYRPAIPEPKIQTHPLLKPELKKQDTKPVVKSAAKNKAAAEGDPISQFGQPGNRYWVQVGAFGSETKAQEVIASLKDKGFSASYEPVNANNATVYRVRVGPQTDRDETLKIKDQLTSHGFQGAIVQ